jgi:acetyltransferase-like isoleucine patch superfamily enzyme
MSDATAFTAHPTAACEARDIGQATRIGAFARVAATARIGHHCEIGDGATIMDGARVGDHVSIGAGARLFHGARVADHAVIGPGATLGSPQADAPASSTETAVQVGANATVPAGITVGYAAIVGAGTMVLRDLPARAVAEGDPMRITGYSGAEQLADLADKATQVALPDGYPARLLRLDTRIDGRGHISIGSYPDTLPFLPRRWFTVSNVPVGSWRGAHCHRACHQLMFAARGRILVALDDGESRFVVPLTSPSIAVHVPPGVWNFFFGHTPDATLVALASHEYDPGDYVADYEELLRMRRSIVQGASVASPPQPTSLRE